MEFMEIAIKILDKERKSFFFFFLVLDQNPKLRAVRKLKMVSL